MSSIKVGDIVTIKDGSYMCTYDDKGKLTHYGVGSDKYIGLCQDKFEVISINKDYPTLDEDHNIYKITDSLRDKIYNNCAIINKTTKRLWFCSKINITK